MTMTLRRPPLPPPLRPPFPAAFPPASGAAFPPASRAGPLPHSGHGLPAAASPSLAAATTAGQRACQVPADRPVAAGRADRGRGLSGRQVGPADALLGPSDRGPHGPRGARAKVGAGRRFRAEANRRFAVRLVFVLFALSLAEGVLRKWVAPGLSAELYFLRDPLVLMLYVHALAHGLFARDALAAWWFGAAVVTSLFGGIAYVAEGLSPLAYALGVRNYWLYMPLMFVVAATFRAADVVRLLRLNVVVAIPCAALVVIQSRAGPAAWINKGIAADKPVATVAGDIVRPYGLFTYTGQNVAFVTALVAVTLALMFFPKLRRSDRLLLVAAAPAVASLAVLTGSRGIYVVLAAMVALTAAGIAASGRLRASLPRIAAIAATAGLALLLFVGPYGDMFAAMQHRAKTAARIEGPPLGRIAATMTSFVAPLGDAALVGFGIGRGTPAVGTIVGTVSYEFGGESEPGRVVYELGPVLGLAFLALRLHLGCHLLGAAIRLARRGLLAALPLAAFAGLAIVTSQLTFSALNAFLPYLAAGCVLALGRGLRARHSRFPVPRPAPAPEAMQPRRPDSSGLRCRLPQFRPPQFRPPQCRPEPRLEPWPLQRPAGPLAAGEPS